MSNFISHHVYHEDRPWGAFDTFTHNGHLTVKILTVNPGESTSLQFHQQREETWIVISGSGFVDIGDSCYAVKKNDHYTVPQGVIHRITGGEEALIILEISTGNVDEQDVIRLDDKYGRADKKIHTS